MKHGEERNRHEQSTGHGSTEFRTPTGELVHSGPAVVHTRSVVERWCEGCAQWVTCDGIMGFLRFDFEHDKHRGTP